MDNSFWNLAIPPLVVLILSALRMVIPKVPGWLVVLLAPAAGVAVEMFGSMMIESWNMNTQTAAAMGMLATWLHQLGKQANKKEEIGSQHESG